jgi:hypothetical protein
MSLFGIQYLSPLSSDGYVKDYQHAAQTFRSNGYANAPKYKFLFYVNFVLNSKVTTDTDLTTLSYLVKNVELPKFDADIQELNQYNKKVLIQTKIKYTPISIKFHDDNNNQVRLLWQNYYNYYFGDGQNTSDVITTDDKYTTLSSNLWGLNTGVDNPFFDSIEIYSMAAGQAQKITVFNPIISHFGHDNHDYADGAQLMENNMTVHYTAVTYENGDAASIPGFNDDRFYDQVPSALDNGQSGVIGSTGELMQGSDQWLNANGSDAATSTTTTNAISQLAAALAPTALTAAQVTQIASQIASAPTSSSYVFPTTTIQATQAVVTQSSSPPVATYNPGSWQQILYNKGYTPTQISQAADYFSNNQSTIANQANAEDFVQGRGYYENVGTAAPTANVIGIDPNNASFSADLSNNLSDLGYSQSAINSAIGQLSSVRMPPSVSFAKVAADYLNNSSQVLNNSSATSKTTPATTGNNT